MAYVYRPRGMPARFMQDAPPIIRRGLIDILDNGSQAVCSFDVLFRPAPGDAEITGLDFCRDGGRGCHFFLKPHEARDYRARNRRARVAWAALPEPTRRAIVAYLEN